MKHTQMKTKNNFVLGDLSIVTLQIVLKKEKKKEEKKEEKETKTCGVFLDSACGCCKNIPVMLHSVLTYSRVIHFEIKFSV